MFTNHKFNPLELKNLEREFFKKAYNLQPIELDAHYTKTIITKRNQNAIKEIGVIAAILHGLNAYPQ